MRSRQWLRDSNKRTFSPLDTPDEDGLLTYHYNNWAGYESVDFRGSRYGWAIAPVSYAECESNKPYPDGLYDTDDYFLVLRD